MSEYQGGRRRGRRRVEGEGERWRKENARLDNL